MSEQLLKVAEVARILGVKPRRLYELIRAGSVPVVKLGKKQYRIDPEALREFIKRGGQAKAHDQ